MIKILLLVNRVRSFHLGNLIYLTSAFQTYVVQKCYPEYKVKPYLFLVDKKTSIDGLNQLFRIKRDSNKRTGVEVLESNLEKLGSSVMGLVDQSEVVTKILSNEILYHDNLNFQESVDLLRNIRLENKYPNWPTSFGSCKKYFKNDDNDNYSLVLNTVFNVNINGQKVILKNQIHLIFGTSESQNYLKKEKYLKTI